MKEMRQQYLILFSFLLFILGLSGKSQDVFLSQFYATPHILNPALTGLYAGDLRINLDYRDQKKNLLPIEVQAASMDMKIGRSRDSDHIAAIGIFYLSENQSNGLLQSNTALFSGAYHLSLGAQKKHLVSLGIQGGIMQSRLDIKQLTFNNQYDQFNKEFNPSLPSGVQLESDQYMAFDANAGIIWYYIPSSAFNFFTGFSASHLVLPQSSFLENTNAFNRKYLIHLGSRYAINDQTILIPNLMFFNQNNLYLTISGLAIEYRFSQKVGARAGLWYRHNDNMLIGSAGLSIKQLRIIFSYDMYSQMQSISNTTGGLEISIEYMIKFKDVITLQANPGKRY